jgi:hypothetical protein
MWYWMSLWTHQIAPFPSDHSGQARRKLHLELSNRLGYLREDRQQKTPKLVMGGILEGNPSSAWMQCVSPLSRLWHWLSSRDLFSWISTRSVAMILIILGSSFTMSNGANTFQRRLTT